MARIVKWILKYKVYIYEKSYSHEVSLGERHPELIGHISVSIDFLHEAVSQLLAELFKVQLEII